MLLTLLLIYLLLFWFFEMRAPVADDDLEFLILLPPFL